jgi:hypothetical protein
MFCLLLRVVDRGELVVQVGTEAVEGIIRISGRPPPTLGSPLVRAFLTACQVLAQSGQRMGDSGLPPFQQRARHGVSFKKRPGG